MARDPAEHLIRCLHDDAIFSREVSRAKHRESVISERRRHARTVRSVAQWRNRPRSALAWLILFIVVALIAFTARLAAAAPDHAEGASFDPTHSDAAEAASFDPTWSTAGAAGAREASRHDAPSSIGRVDLTITWRRTVRVAEMRGIDPDGADSIHAIASPVDPVTTARGVLWVLLTWTR